jgi:hypothetical protein
MSDSKFANGDDVSWKSQAGGGWATKTGTIVAVVNAKTQPKFDTLMRKHGARSNYGGGMRRDHESYIVLVPCGKTDKAKPILYWPRAAALSKANSKKPAGCTGETCGGCQ